MRDVYQNVTDRIVAMLENGVRPWAQGWNAYAGGGRPLRADGIAYRGANVLNLWAAGMARGFSSPYWLTFKRAQELGGHVRKGAKSELAFYVGTVTREVETAAGETDEKTIPFLKSYCVFNAEEVADLPEHFYRPRETRSLPEHARMPAVDAWIAGTGAKVTHGGGRAFYRPSTDEIRLPEFGAFDSAHAYYATALHELTHFTGAPHRLDRTKGKLFGDPDYAFEELVAELGAAYLCADLGVSNEPREDHASYVASWLRALKDDKRAIFSAAAHAERAAAWLHKAQEPPEQLAA
jgi:antirestriction protein ArdC